MNGGGYDSFVTTMLGALDTEPTVVDAVSVSDLPGAAEAPPVGTTTTTPMTTGPRRATTRATT